MSSVSVLRQPPEYPASVRPDHVQALDCPPAWARATELAFLRFERRNLDQAQRFWEDFGLLTVSRTDDCLVMRAHGAAPAVLVATRARRSRYVGAAFVVSSDADLQRVRAEGAAMPLDPGQIPGGGQGVALTDPDGNELWLLHGWGRVEPLPRRAPLTDQLNSLDRQPRVNATIRAPIEPAAVGRLGHVVLQTADFARLAGWYQRHLGVLPTDVQYLPDGSPLLTFFRLDLGDEPADHHTLVIAGGLQPRYEHSAWEVTDLDALGQGHQVLRAAGHRHLWGIGRHLLGSQLFDYWCDAEGAEFEHYTDGDRFTADHETRYVPFHPGSVWAWGPDAPDSMFPRPGPVLLWRALRLVWQGRLSLARLRLMGRVVGQASRPWR